MGEALFFDPQVWEIQWVDIEQRAFSVVATSTEPVTQAYPPECVITGMSPSSEGRAIQASF